MPVVVNPRIVLTVLMVRVVPLSLMFLVFVLFPMPL